jgi:hypothetical protein
MDDGRVTQAATRLLNDAAQLGHPRGYGREPDELGTRLEGDDSG